MKNQEGNMMYQSFENTVLRGEADDADLWLLLVGKTGSGKSTTGNILFNDRVFKSEMSSSSVTRVCKSHTGSVQNRSVTVVDTPDFRFSTHTDFDSDSQLKRVFELCSAGVHVILLFLPLCTFTEQEMEFISWFEHTFGTEALRFTLVLFTHADLRHMRTLGEMIRANPQLSAFIGRCGQRYHEFNIKAPANRRQVNELMEKIDRLVSENRNSSYKLEMMRVKEGKWRKQIKLKYVSVFLFFAVVTGGVQVWRKDSSHGWMFTKGFFTGGSAAAVGIFTGVFWRLLCKSSLICSSSHERPSAVRQLLLKVAGVVCGLSAGAVIGSFLGGHELPVTALAGLAGLAGAFTAIQ